MINKSFGNLLQIPSNFAKKDKSSLMSQNILAGIDEIEEKSDSDKNFEEIKFKDDDEEEEEIHSNGESDGVKEIIYELEKKESIKERQIEEGNYMRIEYDNGYYEVKN